MASAETAPPKHTNRLVTEHSLYLRQHAHNPVDWFPWGAQTEEGAFFCSLDASFPGEEAFQKAQREGKPIFLSIGCACRSRRRGERKLTWNCPQTRLVTGAT